MIARIQSSKTNSSYETLNSDKSIVILYHKDCVDGFSGAWAAWKKFKERAAYIPLHHKDPLPKGLTGKEIYMIDITLERDVVDRLIQDNVRVTAIDHHISAESVTKHTHEYSYASNHSGSVLAWKYFHPRKRVPRMLKYIEAIDLNHFTMLVPRRAMAFIETNELDFHTWNRLVAGFEDTKVRARYLEQGKVLLLYQEKMLAMLVEDAEPVIFEQHKAHALNSPRLAVGIGNFLARLYPPVAIVWTAKNGTISVSLRSDGTVDVAELAAKFGGGGHRVAAGFTLSADQPFPWQRIR